MATTKKANCPHCDAELRCPTCDTPLMPATVNELEPQTFGYLCPSCMVRLSGLPPDAEVANAEWRGPRDVVYKQDN
jgi:hypothetical protein